MKSIDTMNKQDLFQEYIQELKDLKSGIESNSFSKKQIEQIKDSLYNGLIGLENNVDSSEKQKFQKILDKLKDPDQNLIDEDINFLGRVFLEFENKQLAQTDLKELRESIKEIRTTKSKLTALRQSVSGNLTPEQEKIKEVKEKVKKYKDKLINLSVEHSFWTKVLILSLPAKLAVLFKPKENKGDTQHKLGGQILGGALDQIKDLFGKMEGFFAQIATVFFSWFAPKEMIKLLAEMKSDFADVDPKLLDKFKGGFSSVTEKVKNYSPEKLQEGKDKLLNFMKGKGAEWFGFTSKEDKEKYEKVLKQWFKGMKDDNQVHDFFSKIASGNIDLNKVKFDDILAGVGAGLKGTTEFVSLLYENGLISVEQISLQILKKGGRLAIQTALFFPKMIYSGFKEIPLEDFYDYIKNNELSEVNKDMFLVMIYRAINTPPFSILQHIAALPGHILAAGANIGQDITKLKVFFESFGGGINHQLDLLSKIEKELTGREGNIYEGIKESLSFYKKGITVSYAFGKAGGTENFNLQKFEKEIKNMGLENDGDVRKLLKELKDGKQTTGIQAFVKNMKGKIESIEKSSDWASSTGLVEKIKKELGGMFGDTNFFKETTDRLSKSLEQNAKIFEQPFLLKPAENFYKKLKYAKTAAGNVDLLDLSHLTKDPTKFKHFTHDLKILARQSPDLLRFAFKNTPVILLGKDMMDSIKKGNYTDILKTYMEFVPIVGPIMFAFGEYKNSTLSLADLGSTAVWFGFDAWFVLKSESKNILKLATMPVVDTFKFIGNSADIIGRYANGAIEVMKKNGTLKIKKGGIFEGITKLLENKPGRVAIAVAMLASMYGIFEYFDKDSIKDATTMNLLKKFAKKNGGLELVNNEIVSNWHTYSGDLQSSLIGSFIGKYMGLDPISFENYVNNIKKEGNEFTIVFDNRTSESNYTYIRDKLKEIRPAVHKLDKKLGITIKVSPSELLS